MSFIVKDKWQSQTADKKNNCFADPKLLCHFGFYKQSPQLLPCYLLHEDQKTFMLNVKAWRKQFRNKEIIFMDCNQKTCGCIHPLCPKDRKFYSLCLQFIDEKGEIQDFHDPNAIMNFGWICDGLTYFFTSEKNRDTILNFIKKPRRAR